jgi:hypothetical protein
MFKSQRKTHENRFFSKVFENEEIFDFFQKYLPEDRSSALEIILKTVISSIKSLYSTIPSLETLREFMYGTLKSKAPDSQNQPNTKKLTNLKSELDLIQNYLSNNSKKPTNHDIWNQEIRAISESRFNKPSSAWRKGDLSIFRKRSCENPSKEEKLIDLNQIATSRNSQISIYPNWWLGLMGTEMAEDPNSNKVKKLIIKDNGKHTSNSSKGQKVVIQKEFDYFNYKPPQASYFNTHDKAVSVHLETSQSSSIREDVEESKSPKKKEISDDSSSISSYIPSNEMKKFYRNEFELLSNSPKKLFSKPKKKFQVRAKQN